MVQRTEAEEAHLVARFRDRLADYIWKTLPWLLQAGGWQSVAITKYHRFRGDQWLLSSST